MLNSLRGGGIALTITTILITLPPHIHSKELREICSPNQLCDINSNERLITNHDTINIKGGNDHEKGIYIQAIVDSFINYGDIITHDKDWKIGVFSFDISQGKTIKNLINYGTLSGGINGAGNTTTIINYGTMGGYKEYGTAGHITIANYGVVNLLTDNGKKYHFNGVHLTLQNYTLKITQNPTTFNSFNSNNASDNSHLILDSVKSVKFADKNSKLILDFGNGFEFGTGYLFSKLVVDTSGNNALGVDLSRLIPQSDIYHITQQGDKFVVHLKPEHSTIGNLYKSNIRTMNNFYTLSNSLIFPRKSQNLRSSSLRADSQNLHSNPPYEKSLDSALDFTLDSALDSAIPLKSYESFSYRSEAQNRRIQRQNKRSYSRQPRNLSQNLNLDSANETNKTNKNNLRDSANRDYYFILTPFVNYNSFNKAGNYTLSGFDYGFLSAFSAKIAESNHLGTHFIMSYGKLGDKQDKDLSIKSLNLNLGLNYKLDLIWDMYIKARGDFYYFLNAIDSLTIKNIKPNNLGFGLSMSYGKDFDFKEGGVLGLEVALDYKALQSNTISLQNNATKSISETYNKALLNLIYADVGLNYNKYFGDFGINAGLGIRGNITANKLAKSKIYISSFNKSVDMVLDNDKILAYANAGISYLLQTKNFDMEFSLQYYGNYGDRGISNGGGFEWRVNF